MKSNLLFPVILLAGVSVSLLPGCYTQLAVYEDEPTAYSEDGYQQQTPAQEQEYDDYVTYPRTRFWLSYSYGYPDWYYYSSPYVYYPSYWDSWNYTVLYPYPWWYDWPPYGYSYSHWYWNRPHYYVYDSPYYTYRSGLAETRNSGVRRSGTERRRDYDGSRAAGTTRSSATSSVGTRTPSSGGRAVTGRSAPTGRTPSIEFTRPRSGSTSGDRAVSSGRSPSTTRSSSILDAIGRAVTRSSDSRSSGVSSSSPRSSSSRPAARPAQSSSGRQSVSSPSSSSRSSSSSGRSSSSSGSSRSSGRKR